MFWLWLSDLISITFREDDPLGILDRYPNGYDWFGHHTSKDSEICAWFQFDRPYWND